MCFLCLRDNPFDMIDAMIPDDASIIEKGKSRARAIKVMINVIEHDLRTKELCYIGHAVVDKLKEQQYEISHDL